MEKKKRERTLLGVPVGDVPVDRTPSPASDDPGVAHWPNDSAIREATAHIQMALSQVLPSDDPIIGHLEAALALLPPPPWAPVPLSPAGKVAVYQMMRNSDLSTGDLRNLLDDIERQGENFGRIP